MTPLIIWSNIWMITGLGMGIVFVILILLVFILGFFSKVVNKGTKSSSVKIAPPLVVPDEHAVAKQSASDEDKAAIATALYLYFQNVHVEESGIITIKNNPNSAWHHELNKHVL